ncbi:uncharacterized protein MYCFIDRAFT_177659 [Pseudocercospora fijiensis CIRAD86]|uniref:Uncharacterized protein n=1 Tax=Pseudocercospora fijiensis (strain CIRAD86) TaxID=383855 RepID=M3A2Z8_PSEFD|nr:uncharacterized protein MYCFIDRAFT_177659 [Pseudocercospora fijiensis CIRAD86]EME78966.1 hypothetical protein MYCFIDRAFT_177659 [Pseudocercospora fijiensis CIRAD86]
MGEEFQPSHCMTFHLHARLQWRHSPPVLRTGSWRAAFHRARGLISRYNLHSRHRFLEDLSCRSQEVIVLLEVEKSLSRMKNEKKYLHWRWSMPS